MASVHTYLTFNGNCEAAFNFYKSVFGSEFEFIGKFKDMPPTEGQPSVSEADAEKIMHVSLPIGNGSFLFGSDTSEGFGGNVTFGNNFSISINAESIEEADKLFNGLSVGGNVIMPLADTFWGAYFGMFVDKFGINWMVNYDKK